MYNITKTLLTLFLLTISSQLLAQRSSDNYAPCRGIYNEIPDSILVPPSFYYIDTTERYYIYPDHFGEMFFRLTTVLKKTKVCVLQNDETDFSVRIRHSKPFMSGTEYNSKMFKYEPIVLYGSNKTFILAELIRGLVPPALVTNEATLDSALMVINNEIVLYDQYGNELNMHSFFLYLMSNYYQYYGAEPPLASQYLFYIDPHKPFGSNKFSYTPMAGSNFKTDFDNFIQTVFYYSLNSHSIAERVSVKKNGQITTEMILIESDVLCGCENAYGTERMPYCFEPSTMLWRKHLK
jgi:hypothetical protein